MPRKSKTSPFGTNTRINHDASDYYNSRLYSHLPTIENTALPDQVFPENLENSILNTSAEKMSLLPDRSVHMMITSPPYNATKEYDQDMSLAEYLALLQNVFKETYRVLVDGGRACVNIANLGRKPYIPLSAHVTIMMMSLGFHMRGEIIWNKGAGAGVSMAWGSWRSGTNPVLRDVHEYILIFNKGSYRRKLPEGKRNTILREDFMEWTKSVWTMNPESARKIGHPAPFPVELPYRLIQLYSFSGDIILDPFIGSGTTALAALKAERKYVGFETNPEYIQLAQERINQFTAS
jgi:DNA modification methylase